MSLVQTLLLRALVARFWREPYRGNLVRWGTALHDRWLLPHFVEADMRDVVADLDSFGYPLAQSWFDPFVEFRFPRFGTIACDGVTIEVRQAIEPWHVLGEEVSGTGTARYVDSSVERLQVKVTGMIGARHWVACNGRRLPLASTGIPESTSPVSGFAPGARRPRCTRRSACRRRSCSISWTRGRSERLEAARTTWRIRAGATTTRFR